MNSLYSSNFCVRVSYSAVRVLYALVNLAMVASSSSSRDLRGVRTLVFLRTSLDLLSTGSAHLKLPSSSMRHRAPSNTSSPEGDGASSCVGI